MPWPPQSLHPVNRVSGKDTPSGVFLVKKLTQRLVDLGTRSTWSSHAGRPFGHADAGTFCRTGPGDPLVLGSGSLVEVEALVGNVARVRGVGR